MKNGWQTKKLGDLLDIQNGYAFSSSDYSESGHFVMRIANVQNGYISLADPKFIKLPADGALQRFVLSEGDILVSLTGNVGRVGVIQKEHLPAALNQRVARISIRKGSPATRELLLFFLSSDWFREELTGAGHGAAQQNVSTKDIVEIQIPVPPQPEQERIVGLLDAAFAGLATAQAHAATNLQNARALFASHLQSVFEKPGKGWERISLQTLLDRGWIESHLDGNHGGDYPRKSEFIAEGIPYISAKCIDEDRVDISLAKYLSPARAAKLRKGIAKDNDVLFAHNATVGPVAILRTDEEKVILGTSLTYYRCNPKHILPEYLAHYMRSFGFKTQYLEVMQQSTRNQVPITKQREFYHVIPPLNDQKAIVGQLDGLFENGKRLETIYQRKLAALAELKKSLLHQAFTGEL